MQTPWRYIFTVHLAHSICSRASPIPTARRMLRSISSPAMRRPGRSPRSSQRLACRCRPASCRWIGPVRIKLLHFNDFHSHISSFTPQGDVPVFSRIASWLRGTRARYAGDPQVAVLAASAGDESGGSIFDALLGAAPESYQVHAGYRLYSEVGIDVGALGNHDLDRGVALLAHAIRQDVRFPVLAANVTGSQELAACCFPAAIFVVKGVRIGFIGLITPAQIRPEPNSERRVTDPVAAALNLIPAVRPLCDVLIILSHLGYSLNQHSAAVRIAGDVELARSLPAGAVHLIVGAHTHNVLNEGGLSASQHRQRHPNRAGREVRAIRRRGGHNGAGVGGCHARSTDARHRSAG